MEAGQNQMVHGSEHTDLAGGETSTAPMADLGTVHRRGREELGMDEELTARAHECSATV